jgi:DNA-binding transcriptional LysR family regulator
MVATRVARHCGSPHYFAAHGTPKMPSDLADHTCVTFAGMAAGTPWSLASRGRRLAQSAPPRCRLNVNTAGGGHRRRHRRGGITHMLSYQGARAVEEGKLVIVLREFESDPMPVTVIHAGQGLLLLKMRSFLEFAVPRLRRSLPTNPNDG